MLLTLPIYVESRKPASGTTVFHARPLFFAGPSVRGERLERVMTRLTQDLGQHLADLGKQQRHDDLAACTFAPRLSQQRLELTLTLRRRTARCRFLFVSFRQFGRRLVFTPALPEVWFDLARGEVLRDRAGEVLTQYFRDLEREDENVNPEKFGLTGSAYVTPLEIIVEPPAVPPRPPQITFLGLGDAPKVEGGAELRRVGRCLDRLYPDELDRVLLREAELEELTRLLLAPEQRPVLLVGPRQVGKTALVHEYVFRQVSQRDSSFRDRRNVWLLAPQRLISGMSYVGQWENRLLAIVREARRRRHILYFDDLLGLFQAGHTSNSTLSIAGVLKPYLERREVRVLGEITPEALRVLRERDRGFADLFHLLPVAEPDEAGTLRILIGVQRHAEGQQRCRFDLDVLPTVLDLQRRYGRGLAFPGKAASFLRQLAAKHRGGTVSRAEALAEFRLRSGLAATFLDRRTRLARQEVLEELEKQVIGQDAALQAAADVIAIAKARINDPDRPLASFLFLGPTGVGKTQCARALAAYLFGKAEQMLRFDLNEYAAPGSAARLVGTFSQPEGLLTSAVRRQPFAVVLFDEVEKAHPEVFDLLLQVLGEGRLTDALGRTADFGNTLIVLTSNLGVRQAESQLGLRPSERAGDAVFVQAAERFFRPEFFNRLDRILPFGRLTRDHVRGIARKLIRDLFGREGLLQRRCILFVEPDALERVVDRGYDPVLGARALKRAIESELAQPVAAQLAALPLGGFTAVRVYPGADDLAVHVQRLEQVEPQARPPLDLDRPEPLLHGVRAALRRIEDAFAPLRPAEPLTLGQVGADAQRYFLLREQAEDVRAEIRKLGESLEDVRAAHGRPSYYRPDYARRRYKDWNNYCTLTEIAASLDIDEYLHDLSVSATALATGPNTAQLLRLLEATALLHALAEGIRGGGPDRVLMWIHSLDCEDDATVRLLHRTYCQELQQLQLQVTERHLPSVGGEEEAYLVVHGPHATAVTALEAGTHLFCPLHAAVIPVQVGVLPLPPGADAETVLAEQQAQRRSWLQALSAGRATVAEDPFRLGRVVRIYDDRSGLFDLRTGLNVPLENFADCLRAALPLPPEVLAPASEEQPSMAVYRFSTLLWKDGAGFYTAMPVEADANTAGFGSSANQALDALTEYLTWFYKRNPYSPGPELEEAVLRRAKVAVRSEYRVGDRIHASEASLTMPVPYVTGRLRSGLLVAALPLLNVRFYYHEPDNIERLVTRYAQQALKGLEPGELARLLPPPHVQLEEVVVRVRARAVSVPVEEEWPALGQVAEPLGERALRKQYAHPWERDALVAEAVGKLHRERTNLLLVGEPGVGKTSVLAAAVRAVEQLHADEAERRGEEGHRRLYWLTSGGRLIAGMKYLGQWEERCEKLIDELARLPGVLCVERLLDLVQVGGTGPGDSVASFLMPYLQRGELRLVAEATPAELDACRRLLPGLVDLFPPLIVEPFGRTQAVAVLDRSSERHAQNLHLQLAPGISDRIYHLFRRFAPYQRFPGAAAGFVRDLCERHARSHRDRPLTPEDAVALFVSRTGLPEWLLRDEVPLDYAGLVADLRRQVIGQDEAVEVAARLVTVFKAGMNDPGRPLGVLLFCGSTGVGKTELARALARVFFGHGEEAGAARKDTRLVRLDMSEYAGLDAVDRLLGPPHGAPSPLVRRLRQQPFCLLLLDEIEKAAAEVFDVLLGVCDEGRLTDRFGRTTTFQSSVIVMTSNLGAEQREAFGFAPGAAPPYAQAARAFFRPEFFNRLDAVVTFRPLGHETIHAITRKELDTIAGREGFRQRRLRLRWSDALVAHLARVGFDARYGARPLQRVLEQRVVAPLAHHLLAHPEVQDTELLLDGDEQGALRIG